MNMRITLASILWLAVLPAIACGQQRQVAPLDGATATTDVAPTPATTPQDGAPVLRVPGGAMSVTALHELLPYVFVGTVTAIDVERYPISPLGTPPPGGYVHPDGTPVFLTTPADPTTPYTVYAIQVDRVLQGEQPVAGGVALLRQFGGSVVRADGTESRVMYEGDWQLQIGERYLILAKKSGTNPDQFISTNIAMYPVADDGTLVAVAEPASEVARQFAGQTIDAVATLLGSTATPTQTTVPTEWIEARYDLTSAQSIEALVAFLPSVFVGTVEATTEEKRGVVPGLTPPPGGYPPVEGMTPFPNGIPPATIPWTISTIRVDRSLSSHPAAGALVRLDVFGGTVTRADGSVSRITLEGNELLETGMTYLFFARTNDENDQITTASWGHYRVVNGIVTPPLHWRDLPVALALDGKRLDEAESAIAAALGGASLRTATP